MNIRDLASLKSKAQAALNTLQGEPMPTKAPASNWITSGRQELQQQTPAQRGIITTTQPVKEPTPRKRERLTVNLNPDLINWARRAVVFTPGQSLTGLLEEALRRELERLEKKRGEAFPDTTATPKKGRPVTIKE